MKPPIPALLLANAEELYDLLKDGLDCGFFDDVPVYRALVMKALFKIQGVK